MSRRPRPASSNKSETGMQGRGSLSPPPNAPRRSRPPHRYRPRDLHRQPNAKRDRLATETVAGGNPPSFYRAEAKCR